MKKPATKGETALKDLEARKDANVKGGFGTVEHTTTVSSGTVSTVPPVSGGWDLINNIKSA